VIAGWRTRDPLPAKNDPDHASRRKINATIEVVPGTGWGVGGITPIGACVE
jgi:hypothetical protein